MTLYEMTQETKALYEILQNEEIEEEEREQILNDMLESIGADKKVESYCQVIKQIESENIGIDAEIERLKKASEKNKRDIDRMKKALIQFMDIVGEQKVKGGTFTVSLRKSSKLIVDNLEKIPKDYLRVKSTVEADKNAIKDILKNGETIEGCHIEESVSAQIK